MYSGISALKDTLRDNDKILKALIDRAMYTYKFFRNPSQERGYHHRAPTVEVVVQHIVEALEPTWEVMRDAFSQGPRFVYEDRKKRRELREALRLLNFSARVVAELLRDSASTETEGYSSRIAGRLQFVESALRISERVAGLCTPGPRTYTHPQFDKWQNLVGRCMRRKAALWLDYALEVENKGVTAFSYEHKMNRRQWDQFQALIALPPESAVAPLLERINGVFAGHPLSLEQEQFEEIERTLRVVYNSDALADKLRETATSHGGLLTREEAMARNEKAKSGTQFFMCATPQRR